MIAFAAADDTRGRLGAASAASHVTRGFLLASRAEGLLGSVSSGPREMPKMPPVLRTFELLEARS